MIDIDNIEYTIGNGFARVNGVTLWVYAPNEERTDWHWHATRYEEDTYPGGCPRTVAGIGAVEGRADTEEDALQLATAAAKLIGQDPGSLSADLSLDNPVVTRLVAVADGPAERVAASE